MTRMRRHSLLLVAALPFAASLAHCTCDEVTDAPDGSTSEAGTNEGGSDVEAGSSSPFGIDSRPANPTCKAPPRPASSTGVKLVKPYPSLPSLEQPVAIQKVPGKSSWWALERTGRVMSFAASPTVAATAVALDLRTEVEALYEEGGLLGLAFHPQFATNGFVYLYYTHKEGVTGFGSRLVRFRSTDGGATLSAASRKVLLDIPRTVTRHLGGHVAFGPDGYLYLGLGDESYSAEAQKTADTPCDDVSCFPLLGKMLRIDVDNGDPYGIPATNPFAGGGGRKEIFAWGLRNPWRWSFDRATGDLWLGDVGEEEFEEIDRISLGGNYGWPLVEGKKCITAGTCDGKGFIEPVAIHTHPESLAIVAGPVYRGTKIPGLIGSIVYGDQVNGTHWALLADPVTGALTPKVLNPSGPPVYVTSYGEDTDGEVFLTDYLGSIYTLAPESAAPTSTFPEKLSATGCVNPADAKQPVSAMIPYGVVAPFWSDGADKERFFALPDGQTIVATEDGDLELPLGSVTMKTFSIGGKRVETRLFVRHDDGEWAGYSYEWNDAQTDATLLPAGKVKAVGTTQWTFPSRSECLRCHTKAARGTLGLELAQLARPFDYPSRPARDQLATLGHINLFSAPLPASVTPLPAPDGASAVEGRARAYLHANCSFCHRPGGPTSADMDLRFATPFAGARTCNVAPQRGDLGIAGAALVKPGNVNASLVAQRMHRTDFARMPPVSIRTVDPKGTATIDGWIAGLTACP